MKRKKWLDAAIWVFGILSFLSLIAFFLALTDIWHDYASPEVFARAGQSLPDWYSQSIRTMPEWRVLQVGFVADAGVSHPLVRSLAVRPEGSKIRRRNPINRIIRGTVYVIPEFPWIIKRDNSGIAYTVPLIVPSLPLARFLNLI